MQGRRGAARNEEHVGAADGHAGRDSSAVARAVMIKVAALLFALLATPAIASQTGMTLEMMLRRHAEDVAALLRLGTDTGEIALTDPVNGTFTLRISQDTLVHLGLGDFDHSNIATINGGYKVRIWSGTFTNNAGATR